MKTKPYLFLSLLALLMFCFINNSFAQTDQEKDTSETQSSKDESPKMIQFAIWDKFQFFHPDTSIGLFRLNLVYGSNKDVSVLDMGGFGSVTGNFSGLQLNLVNYVKGDVKGLQTGIYNSAGNSKSIQIGLLNSAEKSVGWQIGLINHATDMNGMQVGILYNTADSLKGIQIGLLNIIWSREPIKFFPIINFAF